MAVLVFVHEAARVVSKSIRESHILLFSIFVAGLCSIIYELLIATTGAYFLGDSITQFSLTIGVYMAAMGIGSYFSRFVPDKPLLAYFIGFELALALLGGLSVPLLYFSYAYGLPLQAISILLTTLIGILIGLEIPLLSRLMEKHYALKANLANVLSIDYFGALLATLLFPFLFLPWLGVFKTALSFGLMNLSIALLLLWYFIDHISPNRRKVLRLTLVLVSLILVLCLFASKQLTYLWQSQIYDDRVVHSEQTPYQQIVLTRHKDDIRLYLNGGLQFSSIDEYRYHEALIHPAMVRHGNAKRILILGGGDGLAARELLKYPQLESITLVDLDPAVARLAQTNHNLTTLNKHSLSDPKVTIIHQDAYVFVEQSEQLFDIIFIDLPDPKAINLARLYSQQFYQLVKTRLPNNGIVVTQATSPFFAKQAFWSINNTLSAAGFAHTLPYHLNVPSFGEWGFVMACNLICSNHQLLPVNTRYYRPENDAQLFIFTPDISANNEKVSTLDEPNVLHYYLQGWKYWN